ncbi:RHS repeat domain-containing protein [Streptomyces sp. Act-28]
MALDATTLAVTKRYTTPFGAQRGPAVPTWPDDKSFLGKPADKGTGLTHVGARKYDPVIAQFLSVYPKLELRKRQSVNGYSNAESDPVTLSDPTGLGSITCVMGKTCPEGTEEVENNLPTVDDGIPPSSALSVRILGRVFHGERMFP